MIVQTKIQGKLLLHLDPVYFDVVNESHMHNVPPGSESHFKIVLVSDLFEGLPLIKRHQKIYEILNEEMKNGIHAVSLHTLRNGHVITFWFGAHIWFVFVRSE